MWILGMIANHREDGELKLTKDEYEKALPLEQSVFLELANTKKWAQIPTISHVDVTEENYKQLLPIRNKLNQNRENKYVPIWDPSRCDTYQRSRASTHLNRIKHLEDQVKRLKAAEEDTEKNKKQDTTIITTIETKENVADVTKENVFADEEKEEEQQSYQKKISVRDLQSRIEEMKKLAEAEDYEDEFLRNARLENAKAGAEAEDKRTAVVPEKNISLFSSQIL